MATTPAFIASANIGFARPLVLNPASDGTLTLYDLITGAANGTRVDRVSIVNSQPSYAAAAGLVVRFYITDTGITRLIEEVAIPAIAAAKTAITLGPSNALYFPGGLFLGSGEILKCSITAYTAGGSNQVDVIAYGGDM